MDKKEFKGFSPKTTAFFKGIRDNNNKPWFEAHKQDYINYALNPARDLAFDLSDAMHAIDPQMLTNPAKIVSRIYRDVRFSKDKSPYKSRLFFSYKRPGDDWMDAPGFYFEVGHDGYSFGMGIYQASAQSMKKFRQMLEDNPAEFLKATAFYRKKGCAFSLGGDKYKRPKGQAKDKRLAEWYAMKNFYFFCERKADKALYSPKLEDMVREGYKKLAPLYKYLWRLKGQS